MQVLMATYLFLGMCFSCALSQALCFLMQLMHAVLGLQCPELCCFGIITQSGCLALQISDLGFLVSCLHRHKQVSQRALGCSHKATVLDHTLDASLSVSVDLPYCVFHILVWSCISHVHLCHSSAGQFIVHDLAGAYDCRSGG